MPLSLESTEYALYTMTQNAARRNLVGNRLILRRNKDLRKKLGILRQEEIFATMGVGLPAIHFRNKVRGKSVRLSWNGGTSQAMPPTEAKQA